MATPPKQKPGRSEQSVGTPPEFLEKVKGLLGIEEFNIDLAADSQNTVAHDFYSKEIDSLKQDWGFGGWSWLNPPYSHITPWVEKAYLESLKGAKIAVLVPASVGSKWWSNWVDGKAHVLFVQPRITFVGHKDPYPKDLALLLYTKYVKGGHYHWRWNE